MSLLDYILFWNFKSPPDNQWRPTPGGSAVKSLDNSPHWLQKTDLEAAVVDAAPFVAGVGGAAHMLQLPHLGWTAPASIFRNKTTMMAMHRTVVILIPLIFASQAAGIDCRNFIPRWAHEREMRRDEEEVRRHVDFGMGAGAVCWAARMYVFRVGRAYWAPVDAVMGGALADLAHREYYKAHGW